MMEDLEALNRRTNLPIRMIQDRPHQQQKDLLCEEIHNKQETYEEHIGEYTIRNENHNDKPTTTGKRKETRLMDQKRWTANYRNKQGEKPEMETEQEQQSDTNQETTTAKEETAETSKQRKKQANQALWKKLT